MATVQGTPFADLDHPGPEPRPRPTMSEELGVEPQAVRSGLSFMVLVFALCLSSYVVPWLVR